MELKPITERNSGKGRSRLASEIELVQALADGLTVHEIGLRYNYGLNDKKRSGVHNSFIIIRRRFKLRTNAHLVAHFLRNGWID